MLGTKEEKEKLTLRLPSWVNCFPQLSKRHLKGFSSLWVIWCARTLPRWAKRLWQISHEKGFSPV